MKKKSDAYKRHRAALRAAQKRQADKALKAPSKPQITVALGYAARAMVADYRAAGRIKELQPLLDVAIERLRQSGFSIGEVTVSRFQAATTWTSPITPST